VGGDQLKRNKVTWFTRNCTCTLRTCNSTILFTVCID